MLLVDVLVGVNVFLDVVAVFVVCAGMQRVLRDDEISLDVGSERWGCISHLNIETHPHHPPV